MTAAGRRRWSDRLLDELRQVGDPPADAVVAELFDRDEVGAVNRLMRALVENDDVPRKRLPAVVRTYLDETDALPDWADEERIALGERFFGVHGPAIVAAFACASLPQCYASRKGVQVLAMTARLETSATRRIGETAQLILNVMAPGGLGPEGRGIRDAQKVRLMHAAVRHLCAQSGAWNPEWDLPVNQEDLAGTLCTFSIVALESLATLRISVSDEEADAYHHTWNCVGHILGIDRRVIADDVASGTRLWRTITERQWAPSAEGSAMTAALVEAMEHQVPGTIFDGYPATLVRTLCGDELADMLDVRGPGWTDLLRGPLQLLTSHSDTIADVVPFVGDTFAHFSNALLEGYAWVARGGDRAPFQIPESLANRWGVPAGPGRSR